LASVKNGNDTWHRCHHGEILVNGYIVGATQGDEEKGEWNVAIARHRNVPVDFFDTMDGSKICNFHQYPTKNIVQIHVQNADCFEFQNKIGHEINVSARTFDECKNIEGNQYFWLYYQSEFNPNSNLIYELPAKMQINTTPCPIIDFADESTNITIIPYTPLFRRIGDNLYFWIANAHQPSKIFNRK
jgi:hypothetical protein